MPASQSRLQIATRIHTLMLRDVGHGIEVEHMLTRDRYARDVLLVCEALRGTELAALAQQFRVASAQLTRAWQESKPPGHVLQATDWSRDTSGFGLTQPPPREDDGRGDGQPERRRGWLDRFRSEP